MELGDSEMAQLGDIYDTTDWNATVLRLSVSPMVSQATQTDITCSMDVQIWNTEDGPIVNVWVKPGCDRLLRNAS